MLSRNKWILKEYDKYSAKELSLNIGVEYPTAALLCARGYSDEESALHFLKKDCSVLYDPYLMKDMDKAVVRIIDAVDRCEKITVYGDYDVDGITSVCNLYKYLKTIGADVDYYIPNRGSEGYGLNTAAVSKLIENKTKLIITVDTGITAVNEVAYASSLGVDTVITDHHECAETLPDAVAVVDPKRHDSEYPFKELAGVGVVFKLICACEQYLTTGKAYTDSEDDELVMSSIMDVCKNYSDLTAIGTIADVMPLADENRLIVSYGLNKLAVTKNIGLNALLKASGVEDNSKKISSSVISFTLAPRINAAGRMGSANTAVRLLLTEDKGEAQQIAEELCQANVQRQTEEMNIMQQAEEIIRREGIDKTQRVLVIHHENWHHGVIGIVASKLTEKYNLPCILISFEGDDPDTGKGSGRSIDGFNLHEALTHCSDTLEKFGGHALAAGLTCNRQKLTEFKEKLERYASENISEEDAIKKIDVDFEFSDEEISLELAEELSMLEPYGASNPTPLFLLRDCSVKSIMSTATNKHSRIALEKDGELYKCVMFGKSPERLGFSEGDCIDIVFNLGINDYRNMQNRQMIIRDAELCRSMCEELEAKKYLCEDIKDGRILPEKRYAPDKEDCAKVFKYLKEREKNNTAFVFLNPASRKLNMDYIKLSLIIDIFECMGFISCTRESPAVLSYEIIPQKEKKPLDTCPLFRQLNEMPTCSVE